MIKILINHQLKITGLPKTIAQVIKKDLTLDNPSFLQAEKYNFYTGKIDKYITLYREEGNTFILPRGYIKKLIGLLRHKGIEYEIKNQTLTLPPVDFNSKIKLRRYQEPSAGILVKGVQGGLVGACGSGKTQIMLEAMARIGQPTIWLTHTKDLLYQLIERACICFDGMTPEEIGTITEGKVNIGKRLTVATVQTLSKIELSEITGKFGAIFIDEGHHIAAGSFLHPIGQFPARYRLWCTATPIREDGLTPVVTAAAGDILYTIPQEELPVIIPELRIIETEHTGLIDAANFPGMIADLINDTCRNRLIVETIAREAPEHYSLVLSDRIEHLYLLRDLLVARLPDLSIEILTGQLPKKARLEIMERAKNRQIDILLATQLAREGLDLPHLDRLFLATPKRASNATQQEIGRIMRPCDSKEEATIFDFWDTRNPIFKTQFWKRRAVYKSLGITVDFKQGMQRINQLNKQKKIQI